MQADSNIDVKEHRLLHVKVGITDLSSCIKIRWELWIFKFEFKKIAVGLPMSEGFR